MKTRISCMRDSLLLLRWGRESVATGVTCVDGDLRMRFLWCKYIQNKFWLQLRHVKEQKGFKEAARKIH